jgi:eukaryotic-like serine/threonine-protein kinase
MRLIVALALIPLAPRGALADDWATFHGDAQRSGVTAEVLARPQLAEAWAVKLDDESVDASPAVVAGRVYVGTATGKVCCLIAESGQVVWSVRVGGAITSSPAVADGRVFLGSGDRCLYALAADSGKLLWRVRTRGVVFASPLVVGPRVLVGSADGYFRCVSAATGAPVWRTGERGEISASAAAADGVVYYGDEAGGLVARSLDDGKLVWSARVEGSIIAAACVAGTRLIVPVMSRTALSPPNTNCVTVCDRASGAVLWTVTQQSSVLHTPVTDESNVYFATVSGYLSETELVARRLTDGAPVWKLPLGGVADSSPLRAGPWLVLGNHDGSLYVVDAQRGQVLQSLRLGAKMFSSPAVSGGRVFIGAQDGKLHCLK